MIFAFYSYKGGVGRTLSLVHTGIRLAATRRKKGYRVLLVDMDLEAPGLDVYLPTENGKDVLGFAGLLQGYRGNGREAGWVRENLEKGRFLSPVPGAENLWVMPSGIKGENVAVGSKPYSYLDVIAALTEEIPRVQSPVLPEEGFFHDLREVLEERFTYVLIDSRAGLADQAYASTLLLADALVLCFRLNQANLEGIQTVLGNFLLREKTCVGDKDVPVIPVATPVPPRGGTDVERWITLAGNAILGANPEKDEPSGGDGADQVAEQSLFPRVQRVFSEPTLEIGEELIFNVNGTIKEGFSEQTPIVGCFYGLADRLSTLNCDADAIAAERAELIMYNEKRDYGAALKYLFKRIRLEPLEAAHWEDLAVGYARDRRIHAECGKLLGRLISEWRSELPPGDPCSEPEKAQRLGRALAAWTVGFGKDQRDAGLSTIGECLSLSCGDERLEEDANFVFGQVVDELVKERESAQFVRDERIEDELSLELANKHYSNAIRLGLKNKQKGGPSLRCRAGNWRRLHKNEEALADYDMRILEVEPREGEGQISDEHLTLLYEQAQTLDHLGWYDWGFRNYRAGLVKKPPNTDVIKALYIASRTLDLNEYETEIGALWEAEDPRNSGVHRAKALALMLRGDYEGALEETRIAKLYSAKKRMEVLDAFIKLALGNPDEACEIMRGVLEEKEDPYNRSIFAIASAWSGGEVRDELIDQDTDESWPTRAIAAIALRDSELGQGILDRMKPQEVDALNLAFSHLLRSACAALRSTDADEHLQGITDMFRQRPTLPVALRNHPEALLLRLTCDRLAEDGHLTGRNAEPVQAIWRIIGAAKGPRLEDLPPRKLSEPIPVAKVKSDGQE